MNKLNLLSQTIKLFPAILMLLALPWHFDEKTSIYLFMYEKLTVHIVTAKSSFVRKESYKFLLNSTFRRVIKSAKYSKFSLFHSSHSFYSTMKIDQGLFIAEPVERWKGESSIIMFPVLEDSKSFALQFGLLNLSTLALDIFIFFRAYSGTILRKYR